MAAEIKAKLSLDESGLSAGIKKANAAVEKLNHSFDTLKKHVEHVAAMFAVLGVAAAAIGAGVKNAFDVGHELADLSATPGAGVQDLMVLQQAFKNAGIEAEKVGPSVNKMQKAIATASPAFKTLGLSVEKLSGKNATEEMKEIGDALEKIQNPAQRAALAMEIFGKGGGEVLAMFGKQNALGDAAEQIGSQAAILQKDSAMFSQVSEELNSVGLKVQGFFVGVADQVAPVLLPLLDKFEKLDFAKYGQQFGQLVGFVIQAFADGKMTEIPFLSAKIAFMNAGNFLMSVIVGIAGALWKGLDGRFQGLRGAHGDSRHAGLLEGFGHDPPGNLRPIHCGHARRRFRPSG